MLTLRSTLRGIRVARVGLLIANLLIAAACGGGGGGAPPTAPAPAPSVNASISAPTTLVNTAVTISWSSTNASSCGIAELAATSLAANGSRQVTPSTAGQFTYTVQCTGTGGNASSAVSVTVPAVPTVTLSSNPSTGTLGVATSLTWSSTDATSCTASGAWTGAQTTAGTIAVTPVTFGANSYTLSCTGAGGSANRTVSFTASLPFLSTPATSVPTSAPVPPNPPLAGGLSSIRSWQYLIAESTGSANVGSLIAASNMDLVVLQTVATSPPLNRAVADPSHAKVILGYVDVAESAAFWQPQFFSGAPKPAWFGKQNPAWPDLWSVQYWDPSWETALFALIDKVIGDGFDGVFLDVLSGDLMWRAGNTLGNPPPSSVDPTAAMATLVTHIRNHLNTAFPGRALYLLGNNPSTIAISHPNSVKALDGIFNEWVYWGQKDNDGTTSEYKGAGSANWIASTLDPAYRKAGLPLFGGDYPLPLTNSIEVMRSFAFYSRLGWIPTVNLSVQSKQIFATGPFMYMATATNHTVSGQPGFTNYLSGGLAPIATLNGQNSGDFFIGGPGQNTISGGAGNDTIYAHPDYAGLKGKLVVTLSHSSKGNHTVPAAAVSINGSIALPATTISAQFFQGAMQVFTIDTSALSSITSFALNATNTSFTDSNNYSNIVIHGISYNGIAVDLASGSYPNGGTSPGFTYTNNGTVTYPAAQFATAWPFPANTSDVIDAGGGTNTVVYGAAAANYTVAKQSDGSWTVASAATAEGPDTLRNVQRLQFSDQTITLN